MRYVFYLTVGNDLYRFETDSWITTESDRGFSASSTDGRKRMFFPWTSVHHMEVVLEMKA